MFHTVGSSSRVLVCALAMTAIAVIVEPVNAQQNPDREKPDRADHTDIQQNHDSVGKPDFARYLARPDGSIPLIHDWSTRHVIYTAGYTAEQADRMAKDPRAFASFVDHGIVRRHHDPIKPHPRSKHSTLKRDWAVPLGSVGVGFGVFPAKYTFDVNAPPSCTNDFVVFPIGGVSTGSTGSSRANVVGTFTEPPVIGQTASITITPAGSSPVTLTLTAGATNSGTTFAVDTSDWNIDAANLAAAINRNLSGVALDEIAAFASSTSVSVYALTAGSRVILSATSDLSNFSWGSVTAGVDGSQADLIGFNNLYAGSGSPLCAGYTYPTFTFSYSAGVGPVWTSPVLSLDGRKIAFVESNYVLGTILHVLTLGTGVEYGSCTNSGTAAPTCATAAVIPGSTPGSNATDYMLPLDLVGGLSPESDGNSSPFVDYSNDVLYVGDSSGYLFSVSPIFEGGTPALRSGFPALISPGARLQSPVVDVGNTGNVFIEDGNFDLYKVTNGGVIDGFISLGYGSADAPVVDSTNEVGYAVANCDEASTPSTVGVLVQFSTPTTGSPAVLATAGLSASSCGFVQIYNATPDNNYFTKGISSSTPGNNGELLVAFENIPPSGELVQYQFTSGIMNATAEYTDSDNGNLGAGGHSFSPLTEFYGNDQAYAIGTMAQSGNTVTVTTTANAFVSNQVVVISGVQAGTGGCTIATVNAMNGEQNITVTSPTSFAFTSGMNATIGGANGSCNLTGALATGPTQDYLFFSSAQSEMFAFNLPLTSSTQAPVATNTTSVGIGTSSIVVDNDSSDGQASSIYFGTGLSSTCANTCAVKLTQAGLN